MTVVPNRLKILILGGSGFIGSGVISELRLKGHQVIATYHNHKPVNEDMASLSWIRWDALTEPVPNVEWSDIDCILHLVNSSYLWNFPSNSTSLYKICLESVFNLLEKAHQNMIDRFVLASTGDVFSGGDIQIVSEEELCYTPESFYGAIKASSELIAKAYSGLTSTAILRFFHPYGPGGNKFLINRLITAVSEEKEITIEGSDGIIISPVYLSDLSQGIVLALESTTSGIFHFSGPDITSLKDCIELMGNFVGRTPIIKSISKKPPGGHAGSYKRAEECLGYKPTVSLETGIKNLMESLNEE